MGKIKFHLQDKKADKPTAIRVSVSHNSKTKFISIRKHIHPAFWDSESQRPIKLAKIPRKYKVGDFIEEHKSIENKIREVESHGYQLIREYGDFWTLEAFQRDMRKFLGLTKQESTVFHFREHKTLPDLIDWFVDGIKSGEICKANQQLYAQTTIDNWSTWRMHWNDFLTWSGKGRKRYISYEEITRVFYDEYVRFFSKEKKMSPSTIGKQIKHLKTIMTKGLEYGYHSSYVFQTFVKPSSKGQYKLALTEKELDILASIELPAKKEKYRDLFLIGCYLGMRFSDYSSIRKKHFKKYGERPYIVLTMKKTEREVKAPITSKICLELLEKYSFRVPTVQPQNLNREIKLIAKQAGLTDNVEYYDDAKRKHVIKPKYELITTHTSRRTGATRLILKGMSTHEVMKITGHESEQAFSEYINLNDIELIRKQANNELLWEDL